MNNIAWLLLAFVLGGLFWPFVIKQIQKLFDHND